MTDRDVEPREEIMRFARSMERMMKKSGVGQKDYEYADIDGPFNDAVASIDRLCNQGHGGSTDIFMTAIFLMISGRNFNDAMGEEERSPSKRLREAVILRDKGVCGICREPIINTADMHIDHVHPWSDDGPTNYDNLQCTHAKCNLKKGDRVNVRQDLPQNTH